MLAAGSPLTVAGAATASTQSKRLPCSLLLLSDDVFEEPSTLSGCRIVRDTVNPLQAQSPARAKSLSCRIFYSGPLCDSFLEPALSSLLLRSEMLCYNIRRLATWRQRGSALPLAASRAVSGLSRLSEPSKAIALRSRAATARSIDLVWSRSAEMTRSTISLPASFPSPII